MITVIAGSFITLEQFRSHLIIYENQKKEINAQMSGQQAALSSLEQQISDKVTHFQDAVKQDLDQRLSTFKADNQSQLDD